MYIRKMIIKNYGPIKDVQYTFPFDEDDKPLPVVILGKNGVGKTIALTNILNSLIEMKRLFYGEMQEVSDGKYYRVGSKRYIKSGENTSYERYEFSEDASYTGVMTNNYDSFKGKFSEKEFAGVDICDKKLVETGFYSDCKKPTKNVFEDNVYLYFPVERYYIPTWENKSNKQLSFVTDDEGFVGTSTHNMIKYNLLNDIESWILDVVIDKLLYESESGLVNVDGQFIVNQNYRGKNADIQNMINRILSSVFTKYNYQSVRIGISPRHRSGRNISIIGRNLDGTEKEIVPSFSNLSSGETMIVGMMASILKEYNRVCAGSSYKFEDIKGIVLIDEIDAHLHSDLLKDVVPLLIEFFPRIQFIVSSHSPFFLIGMQEKYGDKCRFLAMPAGIEINGVQEFDEVSRCYSIIDENYEVILNSLSETKEKLKDISKPLIITEGKTDWKHISNALKVYQENGKYLSLDFAFLEYETDMGDTELERLLKNLSKVPHNNIIIGVFDNDSSTGEKYVKPVNFGNNVFGCSISDVKGYNCGISIELLYERADVTKTNQEGRRIYLSDEFTVKSHQLIENKEIVCLNKTLVDAEKRKLIKVVDKEVFDSDENSLAMSKELFAELIYKHEAPFDAVDLTGFENILTVLQEIIESR